MVSESELISHRLREQSVIRELGEAEKITWLSVGSVETKQPSFIKQKTANNRTPTDLSSYPISFLIGGSSTVLLVGTIFSIFDAKHLYICFTVLFLAGSALCGGAPTMNAFIVGRVIAGFGGNGMYMGVLTLLSVNTSIKERPAYLSLT